MKPDISIVEMDLNLGQMAFSEAISKLGKSSNLAGYILTVHPDLLDKAIEIKDNFDRVDSLDVRIRIDHALKQDQWRVSLTDVTRVLFSSPFGPDNEDLPF